MDRAYAILEFRSVNDEQRIIEGIASTDMMDDYDSILDPAGARYSLPLPLLWQHDRESPVGEVTSAEVVGGQIRVRAQIRKIDEPGAFKDLTDKAWQGVRYRLVKGFSVGFLPIKTVKNRFTEWAWRELSLVTLPANSQATINSIRSSFAASGDRGSTNPGVSGPTNNPRHGKMTIQEQITQHENSRAAKVARQSALMETAGTEGTTLDETQAEEYDTLTREVDAIDGHLTRLSSLKRANESAAVPVGTPKKIDEGSQNRGGIPVVRTRPNTEPGIGFARYVMSLVAAKGVRSEAAEYARAAWGDAGEEIALHHRAAIAPGTTQNATFASPLVPTTFLNDFLELLRPATLIGRIPGLRRVPFNISMPSQTAGGTYKWVGEGKYKPVTNLQVAAVTLGTAKASGIIVITEELARSSAPSAQEVVRQELINGITGFLDVQFIDPAVAAVANQNPASITNGVAGTVASGTAEANARADVKALLSGFVTANLGLSGVVLLMNEAVAFKLAATVNSVGQLAFPGMTATGGTLLGIPVVTSNAITAAIGIIAVHAPSILLADEGGVEIDVSREASLQMDSAPTDPPVDATVHVNLWQANLVAMRCERFINWGKARAGAVDRIHTVAYL